MAHTGRRTVLELFGFTDVLVCGEPEEPEEVGLEELRDLDRCGHKGSAGVHIGRCRIVRSWRRVVVRRRARPGDHGFGGGSQEC